MSIPLQFASLYDGQGVFVWSDFLLDLGTYFLVGNMVFLWRYVVVSGSSTSFSVKTENGAVDMTFKFNY